MRRTKEVDRVSKDTRCPHCDVQHLASKMAILDITICLAIFGTILGDCLPEPWQRGCLWVTLLALGLAGFIRVALWNGDNKKSNSNNSHS